MKKATDGLLGVPQNETFAISMDGLTDAFDFLARAVATLGLEESVAQRLCVIVDEVCSNLMRHDRSLTKTDQFHLSLEQAPSGVALTISDPGEPFDLTGYTPDEVPEIGGHGIALVTGLASDVRYCRQDAKNLLTVVLAADLNASQRQKTGG